ncbi:ALP1-like protein [Tanacetum coccineum]
MVTHWFTHTVLSALTLCIYTDQRGTVVIATVFDESEQRLFRLYLLIITNLNLQVFPMVAAARRGRIWHAFFGVAGANNDLTVLNDSRLFDDLLDGIAPMVPYEVNEVMFEKGYYLADGIYPQWATFVKSFTVERDERNAVFKRC